MPGAGKTSKPKEPKIVQITNDNNGIASVLFSDGRVFMWNWTDKVKREGWWSELTYPDLKQFSKP